MKAGVERVNKSIDVQCPEQSMAHSEHHPCYPIILTKLLLLLPLLKAGWWWFQRHHFDKKHENDLNFFVYIIVHLYAYNSKIKVA